jgi:hypothetical protein
VSSLSTSPLPRRVGTAHHRGLTIFLIQNKGIPIAVGIIIGVGVGVGIDPDPDSDPDPDGNQEQTAAIWWAMPTLHEGTEFRGARSLDQPRVTSYFFI